ncbi:MAG: glycosyltransferase family 4 protein [Deltaproteobacteria bacterium]|nr:glycosyltransferase family 4 protein [Deltaproteobacteria bacterium]
MRIAIVAPYWNPPVFRGGISRVVFELRRVWLAAGHHVAVFSPEARHRPSEAVYRVPIPGMPMRALWVSFYLAATGKLANYDVVFPQSALFAFFVDRSGCVPFVHTLSSAEALGEPWRVWRRLYPALETAALRKLRRVVTLSEDSVRGLVERHRVAPAAICKISNGVDPERFSPAPAGARSGFTVVAAGRFIPRKRFDLLLRAFARVQSSFPASKLVLAGEGELGPRLRELAQDLGLGEAAVFPGLLDEEGMLALYRGADVFALPSDAEGMPMVALEAQACALPVVVGPFASAPEVVRDGVTGFVVEGGEDAWAEALGRLASDARGRAAMGASARAHIEKEFGWNRAAEQILSCFREATRE